MSDSPPDSAPTLPRWRLVLVLFPGILGFAASVAAIYATPIEGVTDLGCGLRILDCSDVLGSRWGKVAGIPLGVLGGFYFAAWILTILAFLRSTQLIFRWALSWTLTVGAAVSLFLLVVLLFFLEGNCLFCLITHVTNLASAALLWPLRNYRMPIQTFRKQATRLIAIGVLAILIGLGLFQLYQIRVDKATAKAKEQTIW